MAPAVSFTSVTGVSLSVFRELSKGPALLPGEESGAEGCDRTDLWWPAHSAVGHDVCVPGALNVGPGDYGQAVHLWGKRMKHGHHVAPQRDVQ